MKKILSLFLILFVSTFSFSQNGNSTEVKMQFSKSGPYTVGETFTVTLECTTDAVQSLNERKKNYDGVSLIYESYTRKEWNSNAYLFRKTFRVEKTGRFSFGGFELEFDDAKYTTKTTIIEVGQRLSGKVLIPLELHWEVSKTRVYKNEPIFASLKLSNHIRDSIKIDEIRWQENLPNSRTFFSEYKKNNKIETSFLLEQKLYSYEIANFIFYLNSEDDFAYLPACEIYSQGLYGKADAKRIEIVQPQSDAVALNAIGRKINFSCSIDKSKAEVGEKVLLVLSVSGIGNFHNIELPTPILYGSEINFIDSRKNFSPSRLGLNGLYLTIWEVELKSAGKYLIDIPDFYWFNLESKKVERIQTKQIKFDVFVGDASEDFSEENYFKQGLTLVSSNLKKLKLSRQKANYFLFCIPAVIFLVGIIILLVTLKRSKKSSKLKKSASMLIFILFSVLFTSASDSISQDESFELQQTSDNFISVDPIKLAKEGSYRDAMAIFEQLLKEEKTNDAIYYDLAYCNWKEEKIGEAVYYIYKAINLNPDKRLYRRFFAMLERDHQLLFQYNLPLPISNDYLFLSMLIFSMLSSLSFLFLVIFRKKRFLYFLFGAFFVALAVTGFFATLNNFLVRRDFAIVNVAQKAILTIPSASGSVIFETKEGTMLKVIGEYEDFYLVKSYHGLEGWIERKSVLNIKM